jgi:hypothetical protein
MRSRTPRADEHRGRAMGVAYGLAGRQAGREIQPCRYRYTPICGTLRPSHFAHISGRCHGSVDPAAIMSGSRA